MHGQACPGFNEVALAPSWASVWLGLGRRATFVLRGGIVPFFVALTGAEPSVMRAGVIAGLSLIGARSVSSSATRSCARSHADVFSASSEE
jgi:predicted membrane metal-binding protein